MTVGDAASGASNVTRATPFDSHGPAKLNGDRFTAVDLLVVEKSQPDARAKALAQSYDRRESVGRAQRHDGEDIERRRYGDAFRECGSMY